jgi:AcrR family transcriptional regulator
MRAIAKIAGVTVGTIYYHCGSKLHLVGEVHRRAIDRIGCAMQESIDEGHATPRTVERFMERLFDLFVRRPSIATFLSRVAMGEVKDAEAARTESLAPLRRILARELAVRAERGQIAPTNPETFLSAASGVVLHLVRRLTRDRRLHDEQAVRQVREEATRFILGALQGVSQATPS